MQTDLINVFFDESGKRKDKPNLMGALAIPDKIYCAPKLEKYAQKMKNGEISLHWNKCTGDTTVKNNIIDAVSVLVEYQKALKFNVINYDYSTLANRKEYEKDLIEEMIYTKFPERIIYGLLRGYGRNIYINTNIYIEDSTEYQSFNLHENIKNQLNIQALYRGEQYIVMNSCLVPKGVQIGVELTDLLLGLVRTIIENKTNDTSKSVAVKNEVIIELINNNNFYSFLKSIKYYEWTNTRELYEVNFHDYLQLFMSTHHKSLF